MVRANYCPSLERLSAGDRIAIKRTSDGCLGFVINGEELPVAANNIPKRVLPVLELSGGIVAVTVTSTSGHQQQQQQHATNVLVSPGHHELVLHQRQQQQQHQPVAGGGGGQLQDSLGVVLEQSEREDSSNDGGGGGGGATAAAAAVAAAAAAAAEPLQSFNENHGRNVSLSDGGRQARRVESYNQGVVLSSRPLSRGERFTVRLGRMNARWTSSVMVGLTAQRPTHLPVTALGLKKASYVLCGDSLYVDGAKWPRASYRGPSLDRLREGQTVGVAIDVSNRMRVIVNGVDQGVAASDLSQPAYHAVVDLYGQCEEATVCPGSGEGGEESLAAEAVKKKNNGDCGGGDGDDDNEVADVTKSAPSLAAVAAAAGSSASRRHCDYFSLCSRFKNSLSLPSAHFSRAERPTCYCAGCHRLRAEPAYAKKGDPVRHFALPVGWCRFPIAAAAAAAAHFHHHHNQHHESWHTAFHGSDPGVLRRVLDSGELSQTAGKLSTFLSSILTTSSKGHLLPQGASSLERHSACKPKATKEDDSDNPPLLFSPTLRYISDHTPSCPPVDFADRVSGRSRRLRARTALQVEINPGSYKVGPPSSSSSVSLPPDPHFKLDETEWLSKERGNTVVTALLVCVQGADHHN